MKVKGILEEIKDMSPDDEIIYSIWQKQDIRDILKDSEHTWDENDVENIFTTLDDMDTHPDWEAIHDIIHGYFDPSYEGDYLSQDAIVRSKDE